MFRVIDTFLVTEDALREHPEMREHFSETGLVAVLDPAEVVEPAPFVESRVRVHRPDGSVIEHHVAAAHRPSTAVGLLFRHLAESDVPRLSRIEVLRGDTNI